MRALEIALITDALTRHDNNRTHAAQALGLSRQGLLKKNRTLRIVSCIPLAPGAICRQKIRHMAPMSGIATGNQWVAIRKALLKTRLNKHR
ncbi:hypothetical protein MBH78_01010 [Oceanimonas sp. NS1]|nr:hypothetical protein [Oceanimonas sp. NS1]